MVSKRKMQYRRIDSTELWKAAHSDREAWAAAQRYTKLVESGVVNPLVEHSDIGGYRVRDPYELLPHEIRRRGD